MQSDISDSQGRDVDAPAVIGHVLYCAMIACDKLGMSSNSVSVDILANNALRADHASDVRLILRYLSNLYKFVTVYGT